MGSPAHAVHVNGLCASRMLGRSRAFAAAADAVAARPDAVVSVVRYHADAVASFETVAVVHAPDATPAVVREDAAHHAAPDAASDAAPDAAYHAAWCAADTATADLVRFGEVCAVVNGAAATNTDDAYACIVDAVSDASDGYEPDAVPVVVVPSASFAAYATLQRAGVACIRPATPEDCAPSGAWFGTDGDRPSLEFLNVADALTYATGHAAPSRMPHRVRCVRRSPVLPGETAAPTARSHGAAAPSLPQLRADAAAGRPVSLAALARAVSRA